MNKTKAFYQIFLLGFYSIITQVLLIKEVFSTFSSNEITAGIILFFWLLGNGVGNFLAKKYFIKFQNRINNLFFLNLNCFLIAIIFLRYFFILFKFTPGEIPNIIYMILFGAVTIVPISLLWGINLNYLYIKIKDVQHPESKIYFIEALGAAIGSILCSFIFIHLNSIFLIIGIFFGLFLILLFFHHHIISFIGIMSFIIMMFLFVFSYKIDIYTEQARYGENQIVKCIETPYGRLTLTRYQNTYSFFNNNLLLFSTEDKLINEIYVSLLVQEAETLDDVLVINQGINGLVQNLLDYSAIRHLYYIESNFYLLNMYSNYFQSKFLRDPRLRIVINDARRVINQEDKVFDAVIINTPDPYDLQLNRYYSYEFFMQIKHILKKRGVLVFKISSSENFINQFQGMYIGSIYNTLRKVFPDVLMIPGENCFFLASKTKGVLTYDKTDLAKKNYLIKSSFYKNYFFPFNFDEFRIESLFSSIDKEAVMNYDLRPITFFYHIVLWTSRVNQNIKSIFFELSKVNFFYYIGLLLILFVLFHVTIFQKKENVILSAIAAIGFTQISLEIVIIFLYQILQGNLYVYIGLIFFSFMLGLSIGSYLCPHIKLSKIKVFKLIQISFIILPIIIIPLYQGMSKISISWLIDSIIVLYILSISVLSGIQLPTAVALYPDNLFGVSKINGLDLTASSAGAFIITLFFIPLYGIVNVVLFLALMNLLVFLSMCYRL